MNSLWLQFQQNPSALRWLKKLSNIIRRKALKTLPNYNDRNGLFIGVESHLPRPPPRPRSWSRAEVVQLRAEVTPRVAPCRPRVPGVHQVSISGRSRFSSGWNHTTCLSMSSTCPRHLQVVSSGRSHFTSGRSGTSAEVTSSRPK